MADVSRSSPAPAAKNSPAMNYAGALCGCAAIFYLFARMLLTLGASSILAAKIPGASLANPAGISPMAASLLRLGVNTLALAAPFLLMLALPLKGGLHLGPAPKGRAPRLFLLFLVFVMVGSLLAALLAPLEQDSSSRVHLPAAGGPLIVAWLAICLLPAIGEELLFRGLLQGWLREYGAVTAILGQALLFGLLHGRLSSCAAAFLGGLALGLAAELSGSLRLGMLFHLYNNSMAFVSQYAQQFWDTEIVHFLQFALLALPILLCLAALISRRSPRLPTLPKPSSQSGLWLFRCPGWLLCAATLLGICIKETFF